MSDRDDLIALRRMAELEAKASGSAPAAQPSMLDAEIPVGAPLAGMSARKALNMGAGAIRGAGSIGASIMYPYDKITDMVKGDRGPNASGLVSGQQPISRNQERRAAMTGGLQELGADVSSPEFTAGQLGGEIAGTAGVGGALARGAVALKAAPQTINALRTSGFATGEGGAAGGNMLRRVAAGAANGGASVGLVDPEHAGTGAAIGAALPPALKGVGMAATAAGRAVAGGPVSDEVLALAKRAQELGIDLPADRITDSKPLNALAASLNYVPGSGRAATEKKMGEQLNVNLSRLVGQDSPNMTMALRKAEGDLGAKFDATLKSNTVGFDKTMLDGIADVQHKAARELGTDGLKAINGQIDELFAKGANGSIDGQAAYNIKRDLDRIGQRNTPEAYHARELKKVLMGALDRSLGPEEAAAFAQTREQYGNMLDLQKLAKNGAEGDISIARLANMKNIGNDKMQELADIAAQFLKPREGAHGAAQRVSLGAGAASLGGFVGGPLGAALGLGATMAGGRGANALLNSQTARNLLMNPEAAGQSINRLADMAGPTAYRAIPRRAAN